MPNVMITPKLITNADIISAIELYQKAMILTEFRCEDTNDTRGMYIGEWDALSEYVKYKMQQAVEEVVDFKNGCIRQYRKYIKDETEIASFIDDEFNNCLIMLNKSVFNLTKHFDNSFVASNIYEAVSMVFVCDSDYY